jgi:hypothetical protein
MLVCCLAAYPSLPGICTATISTPGSIHMLYCCVPRPAAGMTSSLSQMMNATEMAAQTWGGVLATR